MLLEVLRIGAHGERREIRRAQVVSCWLGVPQHFISKLFFFSFGQLSCSICMKYIQFSSLPFGKYWIEHVKNVNIFIIFKFISISSHHPIISPFLPFYKHQNSRWSLLDSPKVKPEDCLLLLFTILLFTVIFRLTHSPISWDIRPILFDWKKNDTPRS